MAANYDAGVTYGERAWHRQDENRAADDSRRFSVDETIKAGLDWTVTKKQLAIAPGSGDESGTIATDAYGIFRTDTTPWTHLGTVGPAYRVLQNREIFGYFQRFLDTGAIAFESCGSLDGGRRVFVQAKLCRDDFDIGGGDLIRPYLLIASGHDGLFSTRVGFTPQRVVCQNTLSMAISRGGLLKVRHTSGQKDALDTIMETVDLANQQFVANCEQYQKLQRCPITKDTLVKYVKHVLGIGEDQTRKDVPRKAKQLDRIVSLALHGRGQSPGELTLWSAYNGVTEWVSHFRQPSATPDKRLKSIYFGASRDTNETALAHALTLAS